MTNGLILKGMVFDFPNHELCVGRVKYRFFKNGAVSILDGRIMDLGEFHEIRKKYSSFEIIDYTGKLIMPGFIDTHIHFPQLGIIGSYGKQLIDWLNEYTFPAESEYDNYEFSYRMGRAFFDEMLKNGTTTCLAYGTSHPQSMDAFFSIAAERGLRVIGGKVLMDRNAPSRLTDTPRRGYEETRDLILKWHGKKRLRCAITPRFAVSCSDEQLALAGRLMKEFPDVLLQTHLSENKNEARYVHELFPKSKDYLGVYEKHGLINENTVLAHCIWLSEDELNRIQKSGAAIVHCPSSNLFLGSGLFNYERSVSKGIPLSIATDVGAGTSFSLLKTLGDAYKVQQLNGYPLTSLEAFYHITIGAARILKIDDKVGNFDAGKEADIVVLNCDSPSILKIKLSHLEKMAQLNIENLLFSLQIIGDDRSIHSVFIKGRPQQIS